MGSLLSGMSVNRAFAAFSPPARLGVSTSTGSMICTGSGVNFALGALLRTTTASSRSRLRPTATSRHRAAPGATAPAHQCAHPATGHMPPREAKHQRSAHHQQHDAQQARAGKTQPPWPAQAHRVAQHPATVALAGRTRTGTGATIPVRHWHRRAKPAPPRNQTAHGGRWSAPGHFTPAHPPRQRRKPGAHGRCHAPPHRKAQRKVAAIGQPGPKAPRPVGHHARRAHARGGPGRVLRPNS